MKNTRKKEINIMYFEMEMMKQPISYIWTKIYNTLYAKPIKSEQEAKEIGEYIAHKFFPDIDYSKYEAANVSDYGDGYYSISYLLPPRIEKLPDFVPLKEGETREKLVYAKGGGGPWVIIEKETGKIILCSLQR